MPFMFPLPCNDLQLVGSLAEIIVSVCDGGHTTCDGRVRSVRFYPGIRSKTLQPGGMSAQGGRRSTKMAIFGWKAEGSSSEPA
jgi:hypothetical protein